MSRVKIRHLVAKKNSDGSLRYYWQPSGALRQAGFLPVRLPDAMADAIAAAESWNAKVDAHYAGRPPEAKAGLAADSVAALVEAFKSSAEFRKLQAITKSQYEYYLDGLVAWAGDAPAASIGRATAKAWLAKVEQKHGLHFAHHTYRTVRRLYNFGRDEEMVSANPFEKLRIATPASREMVWTPAQLETFCQAARAMGRPSMALAALLGWYTGQREGDILRLTWSAYHDGRITLSQSKTGAKVSVPVLEPLRLALDAAKAAQTERAREASLAGRPAPAPIFVAVSEETGQAWKGDNFRHWYAAIRKAADLPAALKFSDLRRTAATNLGRAGCTDDEIRAITGHKTRGVVAVYVRPDSDYAANAIDKLAAAEGITSPVTRLTPRPKSE